jgi:hypothetical protein
MIVALSDDFHFLILSKNKTTNQATDETPPGQSLNPWPDDFMVYRVSLRTRFLKSGKTRKRFLLVQIIFAL